MTDWLSRLRDGEEQALDRLIPLLYDDLRQLARSHLRSERSAHTLNPTALVNEAMLRLVGRSTPWESRGHFLGVAARAMRSILADHARARGAQKRGGNRKREPLDAAVAWFEENRVDLLALDDALKRFAQLDARAAQIVELRYFAGLTQAEIAEMLGVSVATVERDWVAARGWLQRELSKGVS